MHNDEALQVYNYEMGRIKYTIESLVYADDKLTDYNFNISISDLTITGNQARIEAKATINNFYSYNGNQVETNNCNHIFTLIKKDNQWLIENDDYSDEFKDIYGYGTNFEKLINNISVSEQNFVQKQAELDKKISGIVPRGLPGDVYKTYNRSTASKYALQYTSNSGDMNSSSYNLKFKYYNTGDTSDCMNFVSQCIWAGFGGTNNQTAINNHNIPMMFNWWADKTACVSDPPGWNWTSISAFIPLVTSNYSDDGYGVRAFETTLKSVLAGDIIYVPGHILFVNRISDNNSNGIIEYKEIYVSAHTSNRRDYNLKTLYGGTNPPSNMHFVKVTNFKYNTGT